MNWKLNGKRAESRGAMTSPTNPTVRMWDRWRHASAVAGLALASSPAFAQLEKASQVLTQVQTWLLSIGAIVVTIAIMFVGFRMMFQAAQWRDVAPVFWGGIMVGSGSAIASLFF